MIFKSFKYRIYPTAQQAALIDQTIGVCRLVYNLALEIKVKAYKDIGLRMSSYDLGKQVPELRREYEWIAAVDTGAIQTAINDVDVAFKNFFSGMGYPNFKSKRSSRQSFRCQKDRRQVDWSKSTISIPKIKDIPAVLSRRFEGKIKTISISKTPTGKYFASVLFESQEVIPVLPEIKNAIGVDLGITHFAILSTGEKEDNPRHLKGSIQRLKILQRRASRKNKGSNNRRKAFKQVAALHEKVANRRNDFLHKLSTKLIGDNQTDTICVESLAVKNLVKNHNLAQAVNDVSWAEFVRQLEYKGKWYGKNVVKIDRFYASSKTCSICGYKKESLSLSERAWACPNCGATHDRDINAAINIKNAGVGSPVEPLEPLAIAGAMKKERILVNSLLQQVDFKSSQQALNQKL